MFIVIRDPTRVASLALLSKSMLFTIKIRLNLETIDLTPFQIVSRELTSIDLSDKVRQVAPIQTFARYCTLHPCS